MSSGSQGEGKRTVDLLSRSETDADPYEPPVAAQIVCCTLVFLGGAVALLQAAYEVSYSTITGGFFGEVAVDDDPLEPILVLVAGAVLFFATTLLMWQGSGRLKAIRLQILVVAGAVGLVFILGEGMEDLWRSLVLPFGAGAIAMIAWRRAEAVSWVAAGAACLFIR